MFHQLTIVGYLGKDPIMRFTPSGKPVCNLNVASSRKYTRGNGEKVDETVWFKVAVWGNQAESCNQYLSKGKPVLILGRLNPDDNGNPQTFQRQDGTTGASYDVTALNVRFLPGSNGNGNAPAPETAEEDEIPF